jgi:hypothetical protein
MHRNQLCQQEMLVRATDVLAVPDKVNAHLSYCAFLEDLLSFVVFIVAVQMTFVLEESPI